MTLVMKVNYYLLFFLLTSLGILPITAHIRIRLGKRTSYRFRIQAGGLPFVRKTPTEEAEGEHPVNAEQIALPYTRLFKLLADVAFRKRFKRAFHLRSLRLDAHIAFRDACATALCFSALNVIGRTAVCMRERLIMSVKADFNGSGSEALIQCIITARLGSLAMTALFFSGAWRRTKSAQKKDAGTARAV